MSVAVPVVMGRRRRLPSGGWLLLAGLGIILGVCSYRYIYTTFGFYDDTGDWLIGLSYWAHHGGLYTTTYSQCGPFYYECWWLIYTVTGLAINPDNGYLMSLLAWTLTAILFGVAVWRFTGRSVLGVLALIATQLLCETFGLEVMEPAHLCFTLVAVVLVIVSGWARAPRAADRMLSMVGCGALCAAVIFTKVNIGVLVTCGVLFAAAAYWPDQGVATARPAARVGAPCHPAARVDVRRPARVSAVLLLPSRNPCRAVRDLARRRRFHGGGGSAGLHHSRGPGLAGWWRRHGSGGDHRDRARRHAAGQGDQRCPDRAGGPRQAVPYLVGSACRNAGDGWHLNRLRDLYRRRQAPRGRREPGPHRLFLGRSGAQAGRRSVDPARPPSRPGVFVNLGAFVEPGGFAWGMPLAWIVVLGAGRTETVHSRFVRTVVATVGVLGCLEVFPVAGDSQLAWASLLLVPVAVLLMWDGARILEANQTAPGYVRGVGRCRPSC